MARSRRDAASRCGSQAWLSSGLAPGCSCASGRPSLNAEQLLQIRRGFRQQHRHRADQRVEGTVGAHEQAAVVEQHHADRTQVEPVVELARRAVGALARHVLGGAVLHRQQVQRAPLVVEQRAARLAQPALAAAGVDQAPLEQGRHVAAVEVLAQALADLTLLGAVLLGLQVDRVDADQLVARRSRDIGERRVGVEQTEIGSPQRCREARRPDQCEPPSGPVRAVAGEPPRRC